MKTKKGINAGVVFALAMAVLAFVIMGVIVSVGASIATGVQGTQTSGTYAYNISTNTLSGLKNVGDQLPLMGTILVFGAVIALLLAVFWVQGKNKGGM